MNCHCECPVRYMISRDGKPCYVCSLGHCRFYALAPVQCEGYTRITLGAPGCPPADNGVILRFEALLHPSNKDLSCFLIRVQGEVHRWNELRISVLQDPQYEGMWYTAARAFLYPMAQYARLHAALKARPQPFTALEPIPDFYFRCVERLRRIPQQYADDVAAGQVKPPDRDDCVYRCLKPFQREGVRFVLERQGRAMIADDMGLGKTVQAIAVAHYYRDEWPVLVVCPMSLVENWAKEFNKFCGIPFARIAILQGSKATTTSLQDVVIVSYSSLKCVEQLRFGVVILDESHYIKAGAAKRAQQSLKLCRESRRAILLSGTPAMSRPIELYAQLQAIQPNAVPSKAQFGARYCNSYVSRFGIDLTGHAHTDELHSLLKHYLIRRTKRELSDALPSKSRQLLYVCITERERKTLEKRVIALRRSLTASATAASAGAENALALVDTTSGNTSDWAARAPNAFEMKLATAQAKIPAVQDYVSSIVEQHLDSGDKLIVFAHHQCMMEAIKAAVEAIRPRQPIDYIYISGETPAAQREPAAEHFRTEPTCTVAILSMQSSGTGHNFTCASTVVFAELDWNPSTHLQCEDRVHRMGQAHTCHIKYLLAEGTADSVIWPLLQAKLSVTTAMFDTANTTSGESRLHHGAEKQNVARRDVAAAPSTPSGSSSTPPISQQSTLDRFLPPPPRQLDSDETDRSPAVAVTRPSQSSAPSPSASLPSPHQLSAPVSVESPLPTPRCSDSSAAVTATEMAAARASPTRPLTPPLVVPFSEIETVFLSQVSASPSIASVNSLGIVPPSRRSLHHSDSMATGRGAKLPSSWTSASTLGADRALTSHQGSATSVLELMRQHTSMRSTTGGTATVSSNVAPHTDVVDLTGGPAPASPLPTATPVGSLVCLEPTPPAMKITFPIATPTITAPRRTVFTLSTVSTTSAEVLEVAPVVHPNHCSGELANLSASMATSSTTPVLERQLEASSPKPLEASESASRPSSVQWKGVNVSEVAAVASPAALTPAGTAPPPPCASGVAVRVPLRANLHLKRPRGDVERTSGGGAELLRGKATTTAAAAAVQLGEKASVSKDLRTPPFDLNTLVSAAPSRPSEASCAMERNAGCTPVGLSAASSMAYHPVLRAVAALEPAASAVTSHPVASPRRTLFKLASNTARMASSASTAFLPRGSSDTDDLR